MGLLTLGTLLTGVGSIAGGVIGFREGQLQEDVEKENARLAMQQAEAQAQLEGAEHARALSSQSAAFGASGVTISGGSPIELLATGARDAAQSRALTRWGGAIRSAQAKGRGEQAKIGQIGSILGGTLGGAGKLAGGFGMNRILLGKKPSSTA